MKPAPFTYHRPETKNEVDEILAAYGSDAKVLAGGQSLVPMLNFRLATPGHIVDINHLRDEPAEARVDQGWVSFGPLVRQETAEGSSLVAERVPLLTEALAFVAHPAIRSRGTIAGSIAHADPAAELPAVLLVLGGTVIARSVRGSRAIEASDLYTGLFETALGEDEWIEEVSVPIRSEGRGAAFEEFARRSGDYALCGVAARAASGSHGVRISFAYLGMGAVPVSIELPEMPEGEASARLEEALGDAIAGIEEPPTDIHATADYRRFLARRLGVRAARRALDRAGPRT